MKTGRPAKTPRSDFGKRLKNLREDANISQKEVAATLGISQPSYAAWERREVALTASQLKQLAGILYCDITDFFTDEVESKKGRAPTGKAFKVFTQVSGLPRSKQKDILEFVEAILIGYERRKSAEKSVL